MTTRPEYPGFGWVMLLFIVHVLAATVTMTLSIVGVLEFAFAGLLTVEAACWGVAVLWIRFPEG